MAGAAGLVVMTIVFARLLGLEFLPKLEEGNLWIRATLPPTISLQEGNAYVNEMRKLIRSRPEVESVVSQHGRPDDGTDAAGLFNAEFFAPLKPDSEWPGTHDKDELTAQLLAQLQDKFPGVEFNFSQYLQDNVSEAVSGVKGENSIKLYGNDLQALTDTANKIKSVLGDRAGRHRPCGVHLARPADHPDRYRSRPRGALRPVAGRHQRHHQGRDRRRHRRRSL